MKMETRRLQIELPELLWQHLEEVHDLGGLSPGEMIREWIELGMTVFTLELINLMTEKKSN